MVMYEHLCRIVDTPAAGPGLVAVPVVEAEQRRLVAQRETGDIIGIR